jgi:hypothetical protein
MVAQQASGEETMRLIIDTDAMAEVDDQNALAYAPAPVLRWKSTSLPINQF